MQIDKEWLNTWFDRFNHDYFSSRLPRPRLSVGRSRTRLGSMSFRRHIKLFRSVRTDFAIRLSNCYDMSEYEFQNVLLHEMIHLSIACERLRDSSPHGPLFRSRMEALNHQFGWHITVTTSVRGMKMVDSGKQKKSFLVLALKMKTGDRLLSVVNPRYAIKIGCDLKTALNIESYGWYVTQDDYFRTFPQVRTPRGKRISVVVFDQKVCEMTPFDIHKK